VKSGGCWLTRNPNIETRNPKQIQIDGKLRMAGNGNPKHYDLEERTYEFARDARGLVKLLPRTLANIEDARQLVNASGSVGANYIEANEALSKKDFLMRVKICRKEAKESRYWLRLIFSAGKGDLETNRGSLMQEAKELTSIFGAIVRKAEGGA
jgi:four helix bundle protein